MAAIRHDNTRNSGIPGGSSLTWSPSLSQCSPRSGNSSAGSSGGSWNDHHVHEPKRLLSRRSTGSYKMDRTKDDPFGSPLASMSRTSTLYSSKVAHCDNMAARKPISYPRERVTRTSQNGSCIHDRDKSHRAPEKLKDEEILRQLSDDMSGFSVRRTMRTTGTLSLTGSPVPGQALNKRRENRHARRRPWTEPILAPSSSKPEKGVRAGTLIEAEGVDSRSVEGQGAVRTDSSKPDKGVRAGTLIEAEGDSRSVEGQGAVRTESPPTSSETHYETYLPTEQWAQSKPNSYVTNHKWGASYKVMTKHGKPFKPETEDWLIENEFRVWLFEKSKDTKLDLNFESPYMTSKSGKKGEQGVELVGPHRDLFEQFHAEKLRKSRRATAAVTLQKIFRGWYIRNRIKRLQSRILVKHGFSWIKFAREYKGLLTRIQKRYGIAKIQTPFNLDDIENFLDRKEKYERIFYDKNVGDKIARSRLKLFFKECGLNPCERDINTAFTAVFRGCGSKAEVAFVVDCSSSLGDTNFQIQQDYIKEMCRSLHVGESNVRIAFIPYNTDVFQCFGLDAFGTREDVIKGIEHVKYHKGVERTDVALKKMRDILKNGREGVPRTCVVITDGGSYASYATEKQSNLARKEKIKIISIGVGKSVDNKELIMMATDRTFVFNVTDYYSLTKIKTDVMRKVGLANCTYCHSVAPEELKHDNRGLFKSEILELVWMIYPPRATGLDPMHRSRWMKARADEECDVLGEADDEAEFNTCLQFVIKDKLERDGIINRAEATGDAEEEIEPDWDSKVNQAEEYMKREQARDRSIKQKTRVLNVRRTEC